MGWQICCCHSISDMSNVPYSLWNLCQEMFIGVYFWAELHRGGTKRYSISLLFCCARWSKTWASCCITWLEVKFGFKPAWRHISGVNYFILRSSILSVRFLGLSLYILEYDIFQFKIQLHSFAGYGFIHKSSYCHHLDQAALYFWPFSVNHWFIQTSILVLQANKQKNPGLSFTNRTAHSSRGQVVLLL